MDSKQQYKMDWLSRARQAEHTLATLQVLQARDAQMIQQIEPYKKDCQKLYQRLQQTQEAIKTETIMLAEFREEVWAVICYPGYRNQEHLSEKISLLRNK